MTSTENKYIIIYLFIIIMFSVAFKLFPCCI